MNNATFLKSLEKLGACYEAREWVYEHGGTHEELWQDCERGDWMAWWIAKNPKLNRTSAFYLALADCASLSLRYFEEKYPKDKRPKEAIRVLRLYARGKATREQLKNAAAYAADAVAYAAAYAAAAYAAAAYAADAAADAAYAAYAAAYAAADAAYAAYAAAYAANAADAADAADAAYAAGNARAKTLKKCADIFRKHFSIEDL